jgi:hypothetical protein
MTSSSNENIPRTEGFNSAVYTTDFDGVWVENNASAFVIMNA